MRLRLERGCGTKKGRPPQWQAPLHSNRSSGVGAYAFLGGSASLNTLAHVEPTCFQIGPVVYGRP